MLVLHVDQTIQCLDARDNRIHPAQVFALKPDQLMLQASHDGKCQWIRYAAAGLSPSVKVTLQPKEVLPRREDFALGDTVSCKGRDLVTWSGSSASSHGSIKRPRPSSAGKGPAMPHVHESGFGSPWEMTDRAPCIGKFSSTCHLVN